MDDYKSEAASMSWEEFFGSSKSDDLLPCLLNAYDSLAATQGLGESCAVDGKRSVSLTNNSVNEIALSCCETGHTVMADQKMRSVNSVASILSSSTVSSSGRSSGDGSSCCTDSVPEEAVQKEETQCIRSFDEQFENSLVHDEEDEEEEDDEDEISDEKALVNENQPKSSFTTSSQYSEDSGIYSSLPDRSWFCAPDVIEDLTYTNRVVLEILETESVYVNDLHQVITGYLDEWRNDCSCALSNEQINDLFNNIEEIYHFNRCFLWELEQCGLDPAKIARCFVENNANFSIYATYCTNYPRSMNILTELLRQKQIANVFRERQVSLQHTLPLGSYLLKPVQRILKYHLLLQNVVKHTPADIPEYNDVTVALSTMTGIAHHINTMKRRHEHQIRVQEVQSLLTGWQGQDLTTFGELYAEGSFRISGAKAMRHIFLFEHMLLVTKKKEAGILNYKTHILCSNLMLVECIPKEPLSFQIIPFDNPRLQFSIHARSMDEKRYWTLELKRVILENYNVEIPSHARQLVMELGQNQQNDNSVDKTSKRQCSTPEYLERRKADKDKKRNHLASRLVPLFRKSDTLLGHRMRSNKLKKNQSLSENSIFSSDTSVNSDESYSEDSSTQNLSETTDDLTERCDEMVRVLENLSRASPPPSTTLTASQETRDDRRSSSYLQKEKLIEEIISQLLVASHKFQRAIKDYRESEAKDETLKYVKEGRGDMQIECLNTSSESLSDSLTTLTPTSPNVWLRQQCHTLASPTNKADSLPRTFQVNLEEEWRTTRPKTIASEKPQMNENGIERYKEDAEDYVHKTSFLSPKNKFFGIVKSPSVGSLNNVHIHPECKFYRTSANKMTFRKMVGHFGSRLVSGRRRSENFYKIEHTTRLKPKNDEECDITYKQGSADLGARIANGRDVPDYADPRVLFPMITPSKKAAALLGIRPYKYSNVDQRETQKSVSRSESSLYEQKFENIAEKGCNEQHLCEYDDKCWPDLESYDRINCRQKYELLTIPYQCSERNGELNENETESEENNGIMSNKKLIASNSNDGTVKTRLISNESISPNPAAKNKQDHIVRLQMNNENIRLCSVGKDTINVKETLKSSTKKQFNSKFNVNISVHKPIRIPPPVPVRPRLARSTSMRQAISQTDKLSSTSKSKSSDSTECSLPTRGWVKQVVDKFQTTNE